MKQLGLEDVMSRRGRKHLPTEAGTLAVRWASITATLIAVTLVVPGWRGPGTLHRGTAAAAEAAGGDASPKAVKEALDAAQKLLDDGMPKKAASHVAAAASMIEQLAGQPKQPSGLRPLWERCRSLRSDLELEGIDVSGITLAPLKSSSAKAAAGTDDQKAMASGKPQPKTAPRNAPAAAKPAISFTTNVVPILSRHCGGCHIAGRKGGFQMTSYAGLMKTGVVQPGVGEASRLVEVILSGDMPRGGGKLSPDEVGTLIKWIDAGAACDSPDPTAPFEAVARQANTAATAMAAAPPAMAAVLKPGELSFASEIAPVLLDNCVGCHDANRPEGNLSMVTPERLMRGGRGGAAVVAGRGGESLLVKKLKGTGIEGQRMPLGKSPLPDETIAMIQKWIDQGAKFDLLGPQAELETIAAAGRSKKLDHAGLRAVRFKAAESLWRRAIPDEKPTIVDRGDVRVMGTLTQARMEALADDIESVEGRLRRDVAGSEGPLVKGGVVVFAFAKAYDLTSFWQTVFSEERPKAAVAASGVTGDVVFAAVVAPSTDADGAASDRRAVLTEQIASAVLLSRAAPAWFARGAGRALAMKAEPKSSLVQGWRRDLPDCVQKTGGCANFMAGRGDPAVVAVTGGGFVAALLPNPGRLEQLVGQLDGGAGFDQAFTTVFRGPPPALFESWSTQVARSAKR